jgi:anthranilate phosphoribosyltransferase
MTTLVARLLDGERLGESEAADLFALFAAAGTPPALPDAVAAAAALSALRLRGESAEEVRGLARAMRAAARRPSIPAGIGALDIVGTGGDGSGSLNLSTGAALLAAAAGAPVVKHGNRAASSRSGSADVLEALGLPLPLDETAAGQCLETCGFTFLFAPHYHPALAALGPVRRALGVRTVFNLLGPLANPAAPPYAVIGAASPEMAALLAETLAGLPIERAFVVHGAPGWDEPTPVGPFLLYEVTPGVVRRGERDPIEAGLPRCRAEELLGGDAPANARRILAAFAGERGAHRDALLLGAGLGLEVAGRAPTLTAGIEAAAAAIDDGAATRLVERLVEFGRREKIR